MVQHTIKIKDREFQFQGELIATGESTVTLDDASSCRMIAKAYAVEGGGYVTSLECQFPEGCGDCHRAYEEIDSLQDIENFFYVFESNDIFGEGLKPLSDNRDQLAKKLKTLSSQYEIMIFDFLDQVHSEAVSRGTKDKDKPIPVERSIWKKLGIS